MIISESNLPMAAATPLPVVHHVIRKSPLPLGLDHKLYILPCSDNTRTNYPSLMIISFEIHM